MLDENRDKLFEEYPEFIKGLKKDKVVDKKRIKNLWLMSEPKDLMNYKTVEDDEYFLKSV